MEILFSCDFKFFGVSLLKNSINVHYVSLIDVTLKFMLFFLLSLICSLLKSITFFYKCQTSVIIDASYPPPQHTPLSAFDILIRL